MSEYRHEYKYICSEQQLALIGNNIDGLMQPDKYAGNGKGYVVRSRYLCDFRDGCLNDQKN